MSLRILSLAAGVLAVALAGCGDSGSTSTAPAPSGTSAPKPEDFPKGADLNFSDLQSKYPAQLSLGIGASVMRQGPNRVPFVVLDKGARPVLNAPVALYTVRSDGSHLRGPFLAKETKFDVSPGFLAKTSADDSTAKVFYTAEVPFKGTPPQGVFALVRMDGRLVAASPSPLGVKNTQAPPPDVGDKAIPMHTETLADGKKLSYLTTRVPPNRDMVTIDFADVLGKKPVVLQFATPALCQSRVCGPVVDVAEQVRSELGDKAAFIQQEIYKDNQPNKGLRRQLLKWRLESEPWTFVIDRRGTIRNRFEGAVSAPELKAAVEKAVAQ